MAVNSVQVQRYLDGVDYPASRDELVGYAVDEGADEDVVETLSQIPDEMYETPADVSRAIGETE